MGRSGGIPRGRATATASPDWHFCTSETTKVAKMTSQQHTLQKFPFPLPTAYRWLIERGLVGFEPNTALQPWYLLPSEEVFSVSDRWPNASETTRLYAFARRQDCDDLACFAVLEGAPQLGVVVIHGWTGEGYQVVARFVSTWEWLKSVVGDIEDWVTLGDHS